ncbi:MAG: glycosyltransferase family 9 protein, partial [Anaerolineae bacterium]|nr:glycosyltransferase family 9 protein [Anaerolineae bacterium]
LVDEDLPQRTRRQQVRLALLRLFARLSAPFLSSSNLQSPISNLHPPPSILLIRPDHLGDLLFTTPALRALRTAFPQARITCLVGPWAEAVVTSNPCIDEVMLCPFPGFTRQPKKSIVEPYVVLWRYARLLREKEFDLAVILRFDHWWGALLAYLARISRRVGYDIAEVKPFLTDVVPYVPGRHEVEQNLALVEAVNGQPPLRRLAVKPSQGFPLEFPLSAQDREFAARYLAEQGVGDEDPLVCIHPGAGAPVKLWRNEKWARLADALAERYGVKVILTGSANEGPLVQAITERMTSQPLVAAGQTTLGQLAALLARCRLVLGVDSGPLHLAVAAGTPTVHLYGPVDSRTFGPWGDPARHVVLTSDMDCLPCNRLDYRVDELEGHRCVWDISETQVIEAARRLLDS